MKSEIDILISELVTAVADCCFGGRLPGPPEGIALAIVDACLQNAKAENLKPFLDLLIPALEQYKARAKRLAELCGEISALRGKIRRSRQDEAMYPRIFRNLSEAEREAELLQLKNERMRLESALVNLLKEYREMI
jgi:hypothetical protein